MKPLELSSVAEIWKTALSILSQNLQQEGTDVQLWFPWGKTWRGHEINGLLPPTELPAHLLSNVFVRFAGRLWHSFPVGDATWLISLRSQGAIPEDRSLNVSPECRATLSLLAEFVKMECLLGLTLRILENRANERNGHWDRVRNLCVAMGLQLRLTGRELYDLELAALLHDIGKVALPGSLLEESRPLSPVERQQIETHSTVGAAMIREIPGLERVAESVLYHHEAPDGSGYPRGLKAGEIPLHAMIVGAADAFDAMTHFRPYAPEQTYHDAMNEMIANTGKFDDRVLWTLQEVLKKLGILGTHPVSPGERPV
jgi:putative nucleotidyltransferase with HDIG domain